MLGKVQHAVTGTQGVSADTSLVRNSEWNAAHLLTLPKLGKTADYSIVAADRGRIIELTGSTNRTFTLPRAADVPDGWFVLIRNKMTTGVGRYSLTRDGSTSDTIDGAATIYGYREELRMVRRVAAGTFRTILLRGGFVEVQVTDSPFTFNPPTGASMFLCEAWGGGGAGAGGGKVTTAGTTASYRNNAGPGGYGVVNIPAVKLGSSAVTVTVGAGATGTAGGTTNGSTAGSAAAGGSTTMSTSADGEFLRGSSGGASGSANSGTAGSVFVAGAPGGVPYVAASNLSAGAAATTLIPGGRCPIAGRQGGVSAGISAGPIVRDGQEGGGVPDGVNTSGGGGAGGAGSTTGNGGDAPDQSTVPTGVGPGLGGGSGGATNFAGARGGHGGNGGIACSGGGGGACMDSGSAGGDGGDGGPGLARIFYYP